MLPTIEVLYSCSCGLKDAKVQVPARTVEDIRVWMDTLKQALSQDHYRRSPHCQSRTMSEVKIPMTGTSKVGGPVEN
jgi:hypothetical protein